MKINHLLIALGTLLGLLICNASPAVAQQNGNPEITIDVSANVITTIEVVTLQSMKLAQAEAQNDRITIDPRQSANAGKMIAIGSPNSEIRISFLEQRELTQRQGSDNLLFNYEVAGNTEEDQSSAEIMDRENRDFEFNEEGRFYLWIGGNVDISTASPGNYQGEFTLEIEYI